MSENTVSSLVLVTISLCPRLYRKHFVGNSIPSKNENHFLSDRNQPHFWWIVLITGFDTHHQHWRISLCREKIEINKASSNTLNTAVSSTNQHQISVFSLIFVCEIGSLSTPHKSSIKQKEDHWDHTRAISVCG